MLSAYLPLQLVAESMEPRQANDMIIVLPYGACDEGDMCHHVVQMALPTDCVLSL